jgi:hypothetical protein
MKTSGYVQQGLPNPDGHIFIDLNTYATSGAGTRTRQGAGLVAVTQAAATNAIYEIPLADLIFRYGMQDDSQMAFGRPNGTSGANALALGIGVVDQTPYSRAARPPIPSAQVFGSGGTALSIAKGISLTGITVCYQVLGAAATAITLGITKTLFTPPLVAPVVTTILANGANGLSTAITAAGVVNSTYIPINSGMLTSRLAQYLLELDATTAIGGTINFFGMFLDVAYNYN